MRWLILVVLLLPLAVQAFPPGTLIPTDSQCYYQNTSCANCTGYTGASCVWALTSWPRISCWPAKYDLISLQWVANTTAYEILANATAPVPAPPLWTPVQDQFHCYWHNVTAPCTRDCLAKIDNSDNSRNNGATIVKYGRNEMVVPATYDPSNYTQASWNSLGFNFYEVRVASNQCPMAIAQL